MFIVLFTFTQVRIVRNKPFVYKIFGDLLQYIVWEKTRLIQQVDTEEDKSIAV
jgi:hypothetical protein